MYAARALGDWKWALRFLSRNTLAREARIASAAFVIRSPFLGFTGCARNGDHLANEEEPDRRSALMFKT
jgi:hypothetical protein